MYCFFRCYCCCDAELAASAGPTAGSPAALPAAGNTDDGNGAPQPSAPLLSPAAAGRTPGTPGWSVDTGVFSYQIMRLQLALQKCSSDVVLLEGGYM